MATLVLTGATGFVGAAVLEKALSNPAISRVICVARRPVSTPSHLNAHADKLENVLLKNEAEWLKWPPAVVERVEGANACIWALGVVPSKGKDIPYVRRVSVDYPLAGVQAMLSSNASSSKTLRFLYLSGSASERDPDAVLYFWSEYRKARGAGEAALLSEQEAQGRANLQVAIARPGKIDPPIITWKETLVNAARWPLRTMIGLPHVPVETLVDTLLDLAINGSEKSILENEDLCRGGGE